MDLNRGEHTHAHCIPKPTLCSLLTQFSFSSKAAPGSPLDFLRCITWQNSSLSSPFESQIAAAHPKVAVRDSPQCPACLHEMPGREEGSAVPRASTASGDCSAGLAKAAVFPLLQLTFEKDPEGYIFTLTLGPQGSRPSLVRMQVPHQLPRHFLGRMWPVPLQN